MATTTRKAPARKRPSAAKGTPAKSAPAPKPAEETALDHLQTALDELGKAGQHAQQDARARIESVMDRVREATKDLAEELRKRAPGRDG